MVIYRIELHSWSSETLAYNNAFSSFQVCIFLILNLIVLLGKQKN